MVDWIEQERLDNAIEHANNLERKIEDLESEIAEIAAENIALRDEIRDLKETIWNNKQRIDMIEFYRRQER